MKLSKIYSTVEKKIGNIFARYGRFIARHPIKVIALVVIINGGLGVGMVKLQQETATDDVYIPQGTQARKDEARINKLFPESDGENLTTAFRGTSSEAISNIIIKSKTGNLLSRAVLEDLKRINTYIRFITAISSGTTVHYSDICAKYEEECFVEGGIFLDAEFLTAVDSNSVTFPEFTSTTYGTNNYASQLGGNIRTDASGRYLQSVEYILLEYVLRIDDQASEDMVNSWMDEFVIQMGEASSDYFDIAYTHLNSLDEELDKNLTGDIALFAVTIALMIIYASIATMSARCDNVGQRMMLGFGGILAAGLAIIASFGFCSAIGVSFVSIVGVMPFLLIGIGIDDMFILLSGLSGAQDRKTAEEKIGETLRTSGVGITITSLTDFLAFMAGAISDFVAVKHFCIYTGVAVLFCYLNNVTLFAACMALNEKRVGENRHFVTCRQTKSKEKLKEDGKSPGYVFCCGGTPPTSRDESESLLDKFPRWLLPKIVLKTPLKIIILVIFAGYLAAAIYGCVNIKEGLEFKQLVSEDSYFYKYTTWRDDYFKKQITITFVIDSTYTYSDPAVQAKVAGLLSSAKSDSFFVDNYELSWLASFKNSAYYDGSSEENFISALRVFFNDEDFRSFENDVVIDATNNKITASRVYVYTKHLQDTQTEGKLMLRSREIASASSLNCFAFSFWFIYYEQYIAVLPQSIQSVGIALVAVFVVTCFFMPHPLLIIYVTIAVLMIMVGVFGFLYYVDVALSAITMIHLIMSIGFSVDFAAHICHGFMTAQGETRHARVRQAIDTTGAPIFHGFVSSTLALVVLAFANSYIFRTFAKVMALVLIFGITHALLLLTVILSWLGPAKLNLVEEVPKTGRDSKSEPTELNANGIIANGYAVPLSGVSDGILKYPKKGNLFSEIERSPTSLSSHRTEQNHEETKYDIYIAGKGFIDSSFRGRNDR